MQQSPQERAAGMADGSGAATRPRTAEVEGLQAGSTRYFRSYRQTDSQMHARNH